MNAEQYKQLINDFINVHNSITSGADNLPNQARRLKLAIDLLQASRGTAGDSGQLNMAALMAEADQRYGPKIKAPAVVVEIPEITADGAEYLAGMREALQEEQEVYLAQVDQVLSVASMVVGAAATALSSGAL